MEYQIKHDTDAKRFETTVDGTDAFLEYKLSDGILDIRHTIVPKPIEGRGIAASLVKTALEYARENNLAVRPSCWYADIYVQRHPQYADLLA